jgi:hypothetical protein
MSLDLAEMAIAIQIDQAAISGVKMSWGEDVWAARMSAGATPGCAKSSALVWTKTADQILESIRRYCQRINDSRH